MSTATVALATPTASSTRPTTSSTSSTTSTTSTTSSAVSLCTFRLGELQIGIDVMLVQEVIRCQEATRVPLVSEVVHGLINLRGEIVTTINLRRRFGLPAHDGDDETMNVVIRTPDGPVALVVDEIGDVIDADEALFELPPPTLTGPHREYTTGVFKLDGRLLLLIDLDRVLDPNTFKSHDGPEQ